MILLILEAGRAYLCADMPSLSESKLYLSHRPSLALRLASRIKIGFLASKGPPFVRDTGLEHAHVPGVR